MLVGFEGRGSFSQHSKGSTKGGQCVIEPELSGYVDELINTQQFILYMVLPQAKKTIVGKDCGGSLGMP